MNLQFSKFVQKNDQNVFNRLKIDVKFSIIFNQLQIRNDHYDIYSNKREKCIYNFQNLSKKWLKWVQSIETWCQIVGNLQTIGYPKSPSRYLSNKREK